MSKKELIPVTKAEMAFIVIGWGLIFGVIGKLLIADPTGFLQDVISLVGVLALIASPFALAYLLSLTVEVVLGTYHSGKGGRDE